MINEAELDPKPDHGGAYPYRGHVTLTYKPERDGEADPGEVVWTWVPFEEDNHVGKDRPVVVLGLADDSPGDYAVLMVSSKDHGDDPDWIGIGGGAWDREGRDSFVRLDRLLAVAPDGIRREGSAMTKAQYKIVVDAIMSRQKRH